MKTWLPFSTVLHRGTISPTASAPIFNDGSRAPGLASLAGRLIRPCATESTSRRRAVTGVPPHSAPASDPLSGKSRAMALAPPLVGPLVRARQVRRERRLGLTERHLH